MAFPSKVNFFIYSACEIRFLGISLSVTYTPIVKDAIQIIRRILSYKNDLGDIIILLVF